MTALADPMPPAESSGMKAKDLKNRPLIIFPKRVGTEKGTRPDDNGDIQDWRYVECDVWILDRQGVEEHGTGVRFGWWRVLDGLEAQIGQYVGARPKQQKDNSVILEALDGPARAVAESVIAQLEAEAPFEAHLPQRDPDEDF